MNNSIAASVVLFLPLFFMGSTKACALTPGDDYLWIEFGEKSKEKDGSLTLPLRINYGRFPDKKRSVSELDALRVFYTTNEKDTEENAVFYEAPIERTGGEYLVRVRSFKTNRFTVLVQGRKSGGETTHRYLAKTSFVLFGHSSSEEKEAKAVPSDKVNRQLEISASPEPSYWPQTGNPVKISLSFNKGSLGDGGVYIFDENKGPIDAKTDGTGNYIYIPPHDKKLNWKGETAFKQTVVVAEETRGNTNYTSSYTLLLHRSRYKNRRLPPGVSIFGVTMVGAFWLVIVKRKRFKV